MIPGNARPAHRRLRQKLAELAQWNEEHGPNESVDRPRPAGNRYLGRQLHARSRGRGGRLRAEIGPHLPLAAGEDPAVRRWRRALPGRRGRRSVSRRAASRGRHCGGRQGGNVSLRRVERRPGAANRCRRHFARAGCGARQAADVVPGLPAPHRFRRAEEARLHRGRRHRLLFAGALPPWEAMDSLVCMGASIGMGLGLRHALPAGEARRVVSVIGDSTFVHSGIPGLVEMVYNPPPGGHVVLILDNSTTAMTGLQEHPGTGRRLDHTPTGKVVFEDLVRSLGIPNVTVVDPVAAPEQFEQVLVESLNRDALSVIITRRTCLLATGKIRQYEPCRSLLPEGTGGMKDEG